MGTMFLYRCQPLGGESIVNYLADGAKCRRATCQRKPACALRDVVMIRGICREIVPYDGRTYVSVPSDSGNVYVILHEHNIFVVDTTSESPLRTVYNCTSFISRGIFASWVGTRHKGTGAGCATA